MRGRHIDPSDMDSPARASFPEVGHSSVDAVNTDEDQEILKEQLLEQAKKKRYDQEQTGEYDNCANLQPTTAPNLQVGIRIDMIFNYGTDDGSGEELLQWIQGVVTFFSDGKNIAKELRGFYGLDFVSALWGANLLRNESSS